MNQPPTYPPVPSYQRLVAYAYWVAGVTFVATVALLYFRFTDGPPWFVAAMLPAVTFIVTRWILLRHHFGRHTYAWYRETFPSNSRTEGRVSCRHCGGTHITARSLMQHTHTRAHVCAQCGSSLYFSPEG